jgi:hypothetical protein
MPNWCENTLTLTGPADQVISFICENRGDTTAGEFLLFSKSVPEPTDKYYQADSHLDKPISANSLPNWYHWRIDNWRTKTEPEIIDLDILTKEIDNRLIKTATYKFKTPWSPGDVWCQKVIEKYPKIKFCLVYGDSGADFSGIVVGASGNIVGLDEGSFGDYLGQGF